jgi:hypothetical protein
VQVAQAYYIIINDTNEAKAHAREVLEHWDAKAACTNNKHLRCSKLLLRFIPKARKPQLPAISF